MDNNDLTHGKASSNEKLSRVRISEVTKSFQAPSNYSGDK